MSKRSSLYISLAVMCYILAIGHFHRTEIWHHTAAYIDIVLGSLWLFIGLCHAREKDK